MFVTFDLISLLCFKTSHGLQRLMLTHFTDCIDSKYYSRTSNRAHTVLSAYEQLIIALLSTKHPVKTAKKNHNLHSITEHSNTSVILRNTFLIRTFPLKQFHYGTKIAFVMHITHLHCFPLKT